MNDLNYKNGQLDLGEKVVIGGVEYTATTSPEYIKVLLDSEDKVVCGIRKDGTVYIPVLENDSINVQLKEALQKIEQETDDKLAVFNSIFSIVDNPEWIQVTTDSEGRILEGITYEGKKKVMVETEYPNGIPSEIKEYVDENIPHQKQVVTITCKRYGTSGVDANFCGLNAIGDAINSITDASENKEYNILVDGHFKFTNPSDITYTRAVGGYSPIPTKDYVNIIGVDKEKAIIEVAFDSNTVFPEGKTYMDYQPIYIQDVLKIKNMTFIGDSCRYVVHVEYNDNGVTRGNKLEFHNCRFISKATADSSRSVNIFGTGGGSNYDWLIKDCEFRAPDGHNTIGLAYHSPQFDALDSVECSTITMENCDFDFNGILVSPNAYNYNRQDVINIVSSKIGRGLSVWTGTGYSTARTSPLIQQQINIDSDTLGTVVYSAAKGIRIKGKDGVNLIRFGSDANGADGVVSDFEDETLINTPWGACKTLGYEYKDSSNGKNAYANSYINVDPDTGTSIGARLGDCSGTSKTLRIVVDWTPYDVIFDQDMTNVSNEDIVAMINSIISSVAVCDLYSPSLNFFPNYKNMCYDVTTSESLIEKGMGVVFDGLRSVRKATSADAKIDGISIDTIAQGQKGRICCKGAFCNDGMQNANNINPTIGGLVYGDKLSIDPENAGKFIKSDNKPVMIYRTGYSIEIL